MSLTSKGEWTPFKKKPRETRNGEKYRVGETLKVVLPKEITDKCKAAPNFVWAAWAEDFAYISNMIERISDAKDEPICGFDSWSFTTLRGEKRIAAIVVCGRDACIIVRTHHMTTLPTDLKKLLCDAQRTKVCSFWNKDYDTMRNMFDWRTIANKVTPADTIYSVNQLIGDNAQDADLKKRSVECVGVDVSSFCIDPAYNWVEDDIDNDIVERVAIKAWIDRTLAIGLMSGSNKHQINHLGTVVAQRDQTSASNSLERDFPGLSSGYASQPQSSKRSQRTRRNRCTDSGDIKNHVQEQQLLPSQTTGIQVAPFSNSNAVTARVLRPPTMVYPFMQQQQQQPMVMQNCVCKTEFYCSICKRSISTSAVEEHFENTQHYILFKEMLESHD